MINNDVKLRGRIALTEEASLSDRESTVVSCFSSRLESLILKMINNNIKMFGQIALTEEASFSDRESTMVLC